jgi:hypothetical protein
MLFRIFMFLVGFGLSIIGFVYIISYLNLLDVGYNFLYYVNFIIRRIECLYAPIGILIIFLSLYMPKGDNNELHI